MTSQRNTSRTSPFFKRFLPVWIGCGIILAALGMARLGRLLNPRTQAKILPTMLRTNLVFANGVWYYRLDTNRFTGWIKQTYPDGSLQSRIGVSHGLLNGACECWFTNGQPQSLEHFKNGVSDGLREKWYVTGQLKSRAQIVHGKMEGTFKRWYENGQLAEMIPMSNGCPEGAAVEYFASGFAKAQTQASAGRVLRQKVWPDGEHRIPLPPTNP
jgi:hypothetical protein